MLFHSLETNPVTCGFIFITVPLDLFLYRDTVFIAVPSCHAVDTPSTEGDGQDSNSNCHRHRFPASWLPVFIPLPASHVPRGSSYSHVLLIPPGVFLLQTGKVLRLNSS